MELGRGERVATVGESVSAQVTSAKKVKRAPAPPAPKRRSGVPNGGGGGQAQAQAPTEAANNGTAAADAAEAAARGRKKGKRPGSDRHAAVSFAAPQADHVGFLDMCPAAGKKRKFKNYYVVLIKVRTRARAFAFALT